MKLADFDYDLPRELIAQFPARTRAGSRMLVVDRAAGTLADHHFRDLPDILDRSYFLVLNDSKVLKARLFARRASGGKVEVFLVRRLSGALWSALLRPSGRIKQGERLYFDRNSYVTAVDEPGGIQREIEFPSSDREGQTSPTAPGTKRFMPTIWDRWRRLRPDFTSTGRF
jgi:S-adenosylmethionine:tRNA ribosyltransferase-isomerase